MALARRQARLLSRLHALTIHPIQASLRDAGGRQRVDGHTLAAQAFDRDGVLTFCESGFPASSPLCLERLGDRPGRRYWLEQAAFVCMAV
jgi:hypothetical protein